MVLVRDSVHISVLKNSIENMAQLAIGNLLYAVYTEVSDNSRQAPLPLLMSMVILIQPKHHIGWGLGS